MKCAASNRKSLIMLSSKIAKRSRILARGTKVLRARTGYVQPHDVQPPPHKAGDTRSADNHSFEYSAPKKARESGSVSTPWGVASLWRCTGAVPKRVRERGTRAPYDRPFEESNGDGPRPLSRRAESPRLALSGRVPTSALMFSRGYAASGRCTTS
jgi:hypothetical protein